MNFQCAFVYVPYNGDKLGHNLSRYIFFEMGIRHVNILLFVLKTCRGDVDFFCEQVILMI